MEAKHTPGPWKDGMDINGNPIIFQRSGDQYMRPEDFNEEWQANLMLASAAPDLLEALQEIADSDMYEITCLKDDKPRYEYGKFAEIALRAIAKATGA